MKEGKTQTDGEQCDNDLSLEKVCGEKRAKLSGGQQQRVAKARAMLKHGTIYLLDEHDGSRRVGGQESPENFGRIEHQRHFDLCNHHLGDLEKADNILYLNGGKILEQGNYSEMIRAKGEFYNQVQARKS